MLSKSVAQDQNLGCFGAMIVEEEIVVSTTVNVANQNVASYSKIGGSV